MLQHVISLSLILIILGCSQPEDASTTTQLTSNEILTKSQLHHDPQNKWGSINFSVRIQEPRVGNPVRYSIVTLNNSDNSFSLIRNRDDRLAKYVIDSLGEATVFLDDKIETDTALVKQYLLQPERNANYRSFYQILCGIPMSLNEASIQNLGIAETENYNQVACYKIPLELKEPLFSKYWNIFIAQDDFAYQGMEIYFPDDKEKGERLYFSGEIELDGVTIPRIRHWHELSNNEYSGSDIIVQELEE